MSTLGHFSKRSIRSIKYYAKGYSIIQAKVRNATSSDPWPPTQRQLEEITELAYRADEFEEIVEVLAQRLNDTGKNWRHVYKSLILIEHVLQHGPENMVHYCKSNFHIIRTLREFQYLDEMGHDQGVHVRQKAMDITNLLTNPSALRHKRRARSVMDTSFLLSLGNTADIDDEENENIRRRDVRVVRTSSPDQTEESPLPGTQSSSGATRGARESSIPGLHDDGLRPQASSSGTRRAASSPKPLDDFFPKARGRGSISQQPIWSPTIDASNTPQQHSFGFPSPPKSRPAVHRSARSMNLDPYLGSTELPVTQFIPELSPPNSPSLFRPSTIPTDAEFGVLAAQPRSNSSLVEGAHNPEPTAELQTSRRFVLGSNNPFARFL